MKIEMYVKVQQSAVEQALLVPLYYMEYVVNVYKVVGELETTPSRRCRWASRRHFD